MSDNNKYYYLKLKEGFFDTEEIKIIESAENGYLYSNILLKMYLFSLKNEGRLIFRENIPYNSRMLSTLTGHNIDVIEKSIKVFKEFGLIEILSSGEIYMLDIQQYIGHTSSEAERKRLYRDKIKERKQIDDGTMSHECPSNRPPEIEIEIEKEIKNKDNVPGEEPGTRTAIDYKRIFDLYNTICTSLPKAQILSEKRRQAIRARYNEYQSIEAFEQLFEAAQKSSFLKGTNDRNWMADFDWLLSAKFMARVLEGKYDDKGGKKHGGSQSDYDHLTIDPNDLIFKD